MIFLAAVTGCQNHPEKENNKPQTPQEINKKNAAGETGDHVTDSKLIPPLSEEEKKAYLDTAKTVAQTTFKIFSSHLKRLFEEKNPVGALEYCKENALKITDSLSEAYGVKIKRTSYRLRNPENKPTDQEEKIMKIFKERIHKNLKPEPYLHYDVDGNPHVYLPIIVQEKCLMCHGDPNKDIPESINQKLAELYPGDKAIFFKKGDLRGIWSIKFPKKTSTH
jgi:uncharacterized protein (UPF0335 family)